MKFSYTLIKKLLPRVPVKKDLAEALNSHSFEVEGVEGDVLDINLPPNRYSDCASHIGIAREAAAIFGLKFDSPVKKIVNPPTDQGFLSVEIQSPKLCPRYVGRYFEIKKMDVSPVWLTNSLKSCGLKPINYVVDLMNYVMLETGQPLHAFDFDKIESVSSRIKNQKSKLIEVRLANKDEKIETLDGQHFALDSKTLVIADAKRPLAIAGVKGGAYAGVTKKTKHIVVEAANFDSVNIFKTSKRLRLSTDASLRFSHDISPELAGIGMDRVTELLKKSGAALLDSAHVYPRPAKDEVIPFDVQKYARLSGGSVSLEKAKRQFGRLGFQIEKPVKQGDRGFLVRIPAWRNDIQNFEDLVEEIARLEGYEKLKPQPPVVSLLPAEEDHVFAFSEKARRSLLGMGASEVYNYSFVSEKDAEEKSFFGWNSVPLQNPISRDFTHLRASLKTHIVKNIHDNSRFADRIKIFEVGKVFGEANGKTTERLFVGIALAEKKNRAVPLELKGVVDEFLMGVGLLDYLLNEVDGMLRIEIGNKVLGYLTPLHHLEKQWVGAFCEIDCEKLSGFLEGEKEFEPLSKYPSIMRDISVLLSQTVRIGPLLESIQKTSPRLIENVDLIDEYVDESSFGGRQSLTFRIVFQAKDRTLTDQEVDKEIAKIIVALKKEFKVEVR